MVGNANVNKYFLPVVKEAFERAGVLDDVEAPGITIQFGYIQFGVKWTDGVGDAQHLTEVNLNEVKGSIEPVLRAAAEKCAQDLIIQRREAVLRDTCHCGHRSEAHDVMGTGPCETDGCDCMKFAGKVA